MAEIAVSFAIDQLLPLLTEEVNLLKGIHKEFADIKDELESIQAFLKDADRRAAGEEDEISEGVKTWVKQVRETTFRIEDIIDDYMIHVRQQPRDLGCMALLQNISHLLKTMIPRHRIASKIQGIKSSVHGIKERSERYGFQIQPSIEQGSSHFRGSQKAKWHDPRMAALYIDESEIVGFQEPKNRLIGLLVDGREERTVISVVGMGGQGKSTLAKKVFDSKEVIGHFEYRVWVTVSQSYNIEGLLRYMLKEIYQQKGDDPSQDISQMDLGSLISKLRNHLQQKRYVFVFDDVWTIDFWNEIEHVVIDNKNGSKIFITTRSMDVAIYCKKSSFIEVHELQPLTEEQSIELFNKKVFRFDFDGSCPQDLIDISSEIARKCKGLPLAIVAIGGLLSTKLKNAFDWRRFNENMSFNENMTLELKKDPNLMGIKKILGFSYDDLPLHLKSCLLYFGLYPEDYKVDSKRLIRQWIAEGFVKEERGNTLEEVAEGYLTELIHRSLVQVSSVRIDGKTKSCCVHDLIRMMILEKCEDLSFSKYISEDGHSSSSEITRRLSIATNSNDFMACTKKSSSVRSLMVFTENLDRCSLRRFYTKCSRLKVLHFEDDNWFMGDEDLRSLIHLKYLSCKNSSGDGYVYLSKSIAMLQNLETLDLRGVNVRFYDIPKETRMFRKLRHFRGYKISLFQLKACIGGMESLQTLSEVEIDSNCEDGIELIKELGKMRQLRKLGLVGVRREHGSALSSVLNQLRHLEKLRIGQKLGYYSVYVHDVIDFHLVASPPMLRTLKTRAKLLKFPEWIPKFQNLVELMLRRSGLIEDPIKSLEKLQNLLSLSIINNAYEGESLHFHDGGLQHLKELYIRESPNLHSIVIDIGALHSLKKFELSSIPNLKTVPDGIRHLEKLEVLDVWDMPCVEFYPKL